MRLGGGRGIMMQRQPANVGVGLWRLQVCYGGHEGRGIGTQCLPVTDVSVLLSCPQVLTRQHVVVHASWREGA